MNYHSHMPYGQFGMIVSKSGDGYISDIIIIYYLYYLKEEELRIDYSFRDNIDTEVVYIIYIIES